MNTIKKALKTIILIIFSFTAFNVAYGKDSPVLSVFHSPSCHRCLEVKKDILPEIEKEYRDRVNFKYYDITDIKNYAYLLGLRDKYDKGVDLALPVFFMNGKFLNGKGDLKVTLREFMDSAVKISATKELSVSVDLVERFKAFKPTAVAGAGLVDGVNPCAFTVIVFFISYLALQGYRKQELIVIGLSFVCAVFLTYLLIGLGIFNFLYRFSSFFIFIRIFNLLIGLFSIFLGLLAIYDFLKFRKNRDTEGLILQLPKSIKNQIHMVIGMHYRKPKDPLESSQHKPLLFKLIISAFVSGFLVSILEAVCTGQLYLPTITFIFKTTPLRFRAFLYLILYNAMFVVPLLAVFLFAFFGVTSNQFAQFIKKHMLSIKFIMAIIFIGLGIFLIWRV